MYEWGRNGKLFIGLEGLNEISMEWMTIYCVIGGKEMDVKRKRERERDRKAKKGLSRYAYRIGMESALETNEFIAEQREIFPEFSSIFSWKWEKLVFYCLQGWLHISHFTFILSRSLSPSICWLFITFSCAHMSMKCIKHLAKEIDETKRLGLI